MIKYDFSGHAYDMLRERNIKETWVRLTIEYPDKKEFKDDKTVHYIRAIKEYGGRYLRVIMNANVNPHMVITLFFDRRIRKTS